MDYFFLGEEELVIAFRFIGIHGMAINSTEEAVAAFRQITEGVQNNIFSDFPVEAVHCQVLIMTEETADRLGNYITEWQLSGKYPLLVEIPAITGKISGRKTLVELIREAIGIHV